MSVLTRASSSLESVNRRSLQARRDRERDFRCQFLVAAALGAGGTALSCAGTGLIVYGLPTADRLAGGPPGELRLQVSLMLYGRLGGVLLGIGIFLIIILAVIGSDYKQYLSRRRPKGEDTRAAMNRRLYADILQTLRQVHEEEASGTAVVDSRHHQQQQRQQQQQQQQATSVATAQTVLTSTEGGSRVPNCRALAHAAADTKNASLRINGFVEGDGGRRVSSMRLLKDFKATGGAIRNGGSPQLLANLRPTWRANEAFDVSDEAFWDRKLSRSTQSLRRSGPQSHPESNRRKLQPFSVESEFAKLKHLQQGNNLIAPSPSDTDIGVTEAEPQWQRNLANGSKSTAVVRPTVLVQRNASLTENSYMYEEGKSSFNNSNGVQLSQPNDPKHPLSLTPQASGRSTGDVDGGDEDELAQIIGSTQTAAAESQVGSQYKLRGRPPTPIIEAEFILPVLKGDGDEEF